MTKILAAVCLVMSTVCLAEPARVLPTEPVYCVTADIGGVQTRVFSMQARGETEHAIRSSMRNALALAINQAGVAGAEPKDLARWHAALGRGVRISGIDTDGAKTMKEEPGYVSCVCATQVKDKNTGRLIGCEKACFDCMACTIR